MADQEQHPGSPSALAELLHFEQLIADISSTFVNLAYDEVDGHIERGLGRVGVAMDVQAVGLSQFDAVADCFRVTHEWTSDEAPVDRPFAGWAIHRDAYPWLAGRLEDMEPIVLDSLDDVPEAGDHERETARAMGIESVVMVPFEIVGRPRGFLRLATIGRATCWPRALVRRMRVIGEVFGNALARQHAEIEAATHRAAVAHLSRVTLAGELVASIAHQLRQPLAAIVGNAGAARRFAPRDVGVSGDLIDALDDIVSDANRATEIIEHLRELLRPEPPRCESLDLNEIVEDALRLARIKAIDAEVTIDTQLAQETLGIEGDPVQLQQVVLNLVANAGESMQGQPAATRTITVTTTKHADGVAELTVDDTGPGIAADRIEHVFEPFVTSKSGSLGMGLAVCRSIVEAHGGRIGVKSEPGGGSVFRVLL